MRLLIRWSPVQSRYGPPIRVGVLGQKSGQETSADLTFCRRFCTMPPWIPHEKKASPSSATGAESFAPTRRCIGGYIEESSMASVMKGRWFPLPGACLGSPNWTMFPRKSISSRFFITCHERGTLDASPVIIPTYKEIDVDIITSNIRTAGMTRDRYFKLLKDCK